jgi:UDP-N-acetylglucosamine:LPS N-acetylglucosamine transferase
MAETEMRPLVICVGASAGGHTNELLALLNAVTDWPVEPQVYVTTLDIVAETLARRGRVHVIGECDRRHLWHLPCVIWRAWRVIVRERPDVIITTGSLPLALLCALGKIHGAKVGWVDSVAQIQRLSMSGRVVRYFADLCLCQWPAVAARYRNVVYAGEVL